MFEEVAPRPTGSFRSVLTIIGFGFVFLSLPDWLKNITDFFQIPYVSAVYELLVFAGIGLLIFRFLRRYATEYKYVLTNTSLVIVSKMGARETIAAEATLSKMSRLIPFQNSVEYLREKKLSARKISYGVSDKKRAYLLIHPRNNGNSALIFQPSEEFVELLKQKGLDKPEEM